MNISIQNRELSTLLLKTTANERNSETLLEHIKAQYDFSQISDVDYKDFHIKLDRYFLPAFKKKFKNSFYLEHRFLETNSIWLDKYFTVSYNISKKRPTKLFDELSPSTKKRRIGEVLQNIPASDLLKACTKSIRISNENQSVLIQNDNEDFEHGSTSALSGDEALAMFLDAKLTKFQYSIIRQTLLKKGVTVLPEYRHITEAKSRCCPKLDVTETTASSEVQSILDHSARRILEIESVRKSVLEEKTNTFQLISKYGCDGTSGFTQYKQAFTEARNIEGNSIFVICTVPILLQSSARRHSKKNLWENKNPSSTKLCRPIKFTYEKESKELIQSEMRNVQDQIKKLKPTKILIDGHEIIVSHNLFCTMVDGKVRQVLTETASSQRCSICDVLPKEMNDLKLILKKEVKNEAYTFGLSTLHAWIRNMEWVLHLSYKVLANVKKYNVKLTETEKAAIQLSKRNVINGVRDQLNMLVDTVKQAVGSSNDGNTARKFFENYDKVAVITGINKEFIKKLYVILQTISSKFHINVEAFKNYCLDTAQLYVQEYPWYPMPSSCHALLIHGPFIVENFSIAIGLLSEEAQEARNKDLKKCRENNTRKAKPTLTNQDIMTYLFASSDPYIQTKRHVNKNKLKELLPEAKTLLILDNCDDSDFEINC